MVGRRGVNRWWAVGMSTLMALSLAAVTGGATMAQDESAAPDAAAAAADCAPVEPAGPLPDLTAQLGHKPKVGLVMKSLANEFFQQMQAGAEAYAAENADTFDFQAVGMKDERDFAAQVSAVENYITQQFDVIVIAPADSQAMVEPIARRQDGRRLARPVPWRGCQGRHPRGQPRG
jgi:ABC-type sugar transport system substrate-binding protein